MLMKAFFVGVLAKLTPIFGTLFSLSFKSLSVSHLSSLVNLYICLFSILVISSLLTLCLLGGGSISSSYVNSDAAFLCDGRNFLALDDIFS